MAISYDLISEFAKITNDNKKENKETNTYGEIVMYGGVPYVKLDGSEIITPCTTMIAVENGDRVAVQIKNHNAFITGGITNPSASAKQIGGVKEDVAKFNTVVTDKLVASDIEAINGYFQQLTVVAGRYEDLTAATAKIDELKGTYASFDRISADDIKSVNAEIDNLKTMMINAEGITTEDLETVNAQIGNLTAYNASFGYLSAEELRAIKANIKHLDVNVFDAETGNIKFAKIDFSNIKLAAIEHLLSESGIIKDITSETGKITGELVGVTIKGDLIEGNTVTADKLVILGEDGAYYKLNIDGLNNISTSQAGKFEAVQNEPDNWETNYKDYYEIINNKYVHLTDEEVPEWSSNKYYKLTAVHGQGLDGTNIIAQTITADKITVSDLVAFGATIGGFHITNHSIYSGVKTSAINTTRGLYMDDNGQIAIGDSNNYFRYYFDETDNKWKLLINADKINIGGSSKSISELIEETYDKAQAAQNTANVTQANLDNINIGGRNLLLNTINEVYATNIVNGTNKQIGGDPYPLYKSLKDWDLKVGDELTMSFDWETNAISGTLAVGFNANPWECFTGLNFSSTNTNKGHYEKTITVTQNFLTSGATKFRIRTDNMDSGITEGTGTICIIKNAKMEKGDKSTDWTPAPEDIDNNIQNINGDISGKIDELSKTLHGEIDNKISSSELKKAISDIITNYKLADLDIDKINGVITALASGDSEGRYSILQQSGDGFVFGMGDVIESLKKSEESISNLDKIDFNKMQNDINKWNTANTYIRLSEVTNSEGNKVPIIILGATDSLFQVRITNTAIDFMERTNEIDSETGEYIYNKIAYANNNTFFNETTVVKESIEIANNDVGFVWKTRPNGNLGLAWVEE